MPARAAAGGKHFGHGGGLRVTFRPVPQDLTDQAAVVAGSETEVGLEVAVALEGAGARVERLSSELVLAGWEQARAEVAACAARSHGLDVLVHCPATPTSLAMVEQWERGMAALIGTMQGAHAAMKARGGAIVVVVATSAMHGARGEASAAMLGEGQRLLAKSAARQWGQDGIVVNCLAVGQTAEALANPALGEPDVAEAALVLATITGITGATLCADGGMWMAP